MSWPPYLPLPSTRSRVLVRTPVAANDLLPKAQTGGDMARTSCLGLEVVGGWAVDVCSCMPPTQGLSGGLTNVSSQVPPRDSEWVGALESVFFKLPR